MHTDTAAPAPAFALGQRAVTTEAAENFATPVPAGTVVEIIEVIDHDVYGTVMDYTGRTEDGRELDFRAVELAAAPLAPGQPLQRSAPADLTKVDWTLDTAEDGEYGDLERLADEQAAEAAGE